MELQVGDIIFLEPGFGFNRNLVGKFGVVLSIQNNSVYHTVLDENENPIPVWDNREFDWRTPHGRGLTLIHRPSSMMSRKKLKRYKFVV